MDELDLMMQAENINPDAEAKPKAKKEKKEKKAKEPKPKRDNIARVNSMTTIAEVRKALQIAIAKKAKAAGKEDTQARYDLEINACRAKLDELLASVKTLQDLLNLGEEPNRVITRFISDKEAEFESWLAENNYKVSKNVLKGVSDELPATFFDALPIELHDTLVSRHSKSDYRLRAVCKNENFKLGVKNGTYVLVDNKWTTPVAEATAPAE